MAPDLSRTDVRNEVKEEGNLLIEAVSLLVQRQRETESWVAEQVWQAEERAVAAERRYSELDERLASIEDHLARLVQEVEPSAADRAMAEQLTRLREQVDGLKAAGAADVGLGHREATVPAVAATTAAASEAPTRPLPVSEARAAANDAPRPATPVAERRPLRTPARATTSAGGQSVGFWELLGTTPQDRAGVLLIGAGAVAVLYALLSQLRFA
ncbi:MAG TPA: hypothetical protein VGQ62_09960 [Chloroflexota bacterium]|nr:hypothetical protein [Chloroflexota bacterium]